MCYNAAPADAASIEASHGLDPSLGLTFQVGRLGSDYGDWLARPWLTDEPHRLFDNALLDSSSKTPWIVVPLLWLPVVAFWLHGALVDDGTTPLAVGFAFVFGLLCWTLLEYLLHRFLFHVKPTSYWGVTLHYAFHGCHHKQPSDRLRLVFPPLFAAPIVAVIRRFWRCCLPNGLALGVLSGQLAGYIAYDCLHHFYHNAAWRARGWLGKLRKHHLTHHFALNGHSTGFGVSTPLWDVILNTQRKSGRA